MKPTLEKIDFKSSMTDLYRLLKLGTVFIIIILHALITNIRKDRFQVLNDRFIQIAKIGYSIHHNYPACSNN